MKKKLKWGVRVKHGDLVTTKFSNAYKFAKECLMNSELKVKEAHIYELGKPFSIKLEYHPGIVWKADTKNIGGK